MPTPSRREQNDPPRPPAALTRNGIAAWRYSFGTHFCWRAGYPIASASQTVNWESPRQTRSHRYPARQFWASSYLRIGQERNGLTLFGAVFRSRRTSQGQIRSDQSDCGSARNFRWQDEETISDASSEAWIRLEVPDSY